MNAGVWLLGYALSFCHFLQKAIDKCPAFRYHYRQLAEANRNVSTT
jgi:hypothetical protein